MDQFESADNADTKANLGLFCKHSHILMLIWILYETKIMHQSFSNPVLCFRAGLWVKLVLVDLTRITSEMSLPFMQS